MIDCLCRAERDRTIYRQCLLRREGPNGRLTEVCYIPEALAKQGDTIYINKRDVWYDWLVAGVFGPPLDGDTINRHRNADIRGAGLGKSQPPPEGPIKVEFKSIVTPRFAGVVEPDWLDLRRILGE